jgi:hypothetical protein
MSEEEFNPEERFIKKETLERFAREWERRSRKKPFTIRARMQNEEEDIIESHKGLEDGTPLDELSENIDNMLFTLSGDIILDGEMELDLLGFISPEDEDTIEP